MTTDKGEIRAMNERMDKIQAVIERLNLRQNGDTAPPPPAPVDLTADLLKKSATVFYHFTSLTSLGITHSGMVDLAQCWPGGIEPRLATDDAGLWQCAKPVVWLTTDPEPDGSAGVCVRLAVTIAATDRNLVAYCDWMQRKVGKASWNAWADRDRRSDQWWMYFRAIPISSLVGGVVCQRRPFWRSGS